MSHAKIDKEREFIALSIAVLTVSDSRNEETDTSGRTLVDRLTAAGHHLAVKRIVVDDVALIREVVEARDAFSCG